ncbi:hypothetical protein [Mesorhizobium sp. ANAO-SY3R2]|uniref:hypothetical protein n=1 Tax=Mesorhizobium sp. ANAO-SY3R2 TaxID=3166644 RepID=UPI003670520E
MRNRPILAAAFPAIVMLLLMLERITTAMLAWYPGSPELWRAWLALRQVSGMFWVEVDYFFGTYVPLQMAGIVAAVIVVRWACLRSRSFAVPFLVNHAALLAFGTMLLAGQPSMSASAFGDIGMLQGFRMPAGIELNGLSGAVLLAGILACASCHHAYLSQARRRGRDLSLALVAVERGF